MLPTKHQRNINASNPVRFHINMKEKRYGTETKF